MPQHGREDQRVLPRHMQMLLNICSVGMWGHSSLWELSRPCVGALPLRPTLVRQQFWLSTDLQTHPLRLPGLSTHQQEGFQLQAHAVIGRMQGPLAPNRKGRAPADDQCAGTNIATYPPKVTGPKRETVLCLFAVSGAKLQLRV